MCSLFSIAVANLAVKAASASKAVKATLKRMELARQHFYTDILVIDILHANSCCYFSEIPANHPPYIRRVLFLCPRLLSFHSENRRFLTSQSKLANSDGKMKS